MNRPTILAIATHVSSTVPFFCPGCGGDRMAEVHDGRRRAYLGRLAIAPWFRTEPSISCTTCRSTHPTDALDVLTTAELTARLVDLTRVLTIMVVRTGEAGDRDLRRRAVQHIRTVIPAYHQNRLDRDLAHLDPASVADHVAPLAASIAIEGKERLVASMVQVALAAHTITSHQRWLLDRAGTGLGLTPMHITGIVTAVASSVEPTTADWRPLTDDR